MGIEIRWSDQARWLAGWDDRGNSATVVEVRGRGHDWDVSRWDSRVEGGKTHLVTVTHGTGTEPTREAAVAAAEACFGRIS